MSTILYVLLAILVLGICIFIHELGHYLAARACGLTVLEFAVGMGPKIIGWRKNDIDYSIRAFPIGGFCSFAGESPDDEESDPRNINLQPAWKRLIMTAAGPFMNFVLALVLAVVLMAAVGEYVMVNRIDTVTDGSPAATAGLLPGDRITAVNGESSDEATEISAAIAQTGDSDVTLTIERGGSTFDAVVAKQYDAASGRYLMGVTFGVENVRIGFFKAVGSSFAYCAELFKTMIKTLADVYAEGRARPGGWAGGHGFDDDAVCAAVLCTVLQRGHDDGAESGGHHLDEPGADELFAAARAGWRPRRAAAGGNRDGEAPLPQA